MSFKWVRHILWNHLSRTRQRDTKVSGRKLWTVLVTTCIRCKYLKNFWRSPVSRINGRFPRTKLRKKIQQDFLFFFVRNYWRNTLKESRRKNLEVFLMNHYKTMNKVIGENYCTQFRKQYMNPLLYLVSFCKTPWKYLEGYLGKIPN